MKCKVCPSTIDSKRFPRAQICPDKPECLAEYKRRWKQKNKGKYLKGGKYDYIIRTKHVQPAKKRICLKCNKSFASYLYRICDNCSAANSKLEYRVSRLAF